MKKIFFSLATLAVVAVITIGGTLAYLSDTATVEGNTLKTGSVTLGNTSNLPFTIENLAPGAEFYQDLAIQYEGSLPADLYIGAKEEGGMDLGPVLQYKLERMETSSWTHAGWIIGDASTWKEFSGLTNLLADYINTHVGLEEGDWARVRLHIRMKAGNEVDFDDVPGVFHWNDYQDIEESVTLILHAVQEGGTPDLGIPRDYNPQVTNIDNEKTYNSISAAIEDANNSNQTILVPQGVYEEDIQINKNGITLKFDSKYGGEAKIVGEIDANGNNITIDGFTIGKSGGEAAIDAMQSTNLVIKNNTFVDSIRGYRGDWSGRPDNVIITNNIFETEYGVAQTEDTTLYIFGNIFNTNSEAVGLGAGVEILDHDDNTLAEGDDLIWLESNNDFIGSGNFVADYR